MLGTGKLIIIQAEVWNGCLWEGIVVWSSVTCIYLSFIPQKIQCIVVYMDWFDSNWLLYDWFVWCVTVDNFIFSPSPPMYTSLLPAFCWLSTDWWWQLDVIGIDEAQFFDDLYEFCLQAADHDGKTVIVAGLDGNYLR